MPKTPRGKRVVDDSTGRFTVAGKVRAHKRHISDSVYRALVADARRIHA